MKKGFFFTVCFEAVARIAQHVFENERILCINFSAKFITEFFREELVQIMPYVDILFGNDEVSGGIF